MSNQKLELPDFDKFAVSFDELLQKGARVEVKRGDPKRKKSPLIIDPAKFRELYPWPEIPSPSVHSSVKDIEKSPRPPLYKDKRRLIVFIGLMLAWLFKGFDDTVITTIVPALCRKFDSLPQIAWFSAAYFLPQACLYIGFGKLAQVTNLRWMAILDGLALTVGSVICILAQSAPVFIVGRVVTGIGIAAGVPLCATILIDITSPDERPTYMASCVGVDVVSLAFGALLGGYLETKMDYRWAFGFTIFGAILSIALIAIAYDQPRRETDDLPVVEHLRRFDFFGFGLLSFFSVLLLIGIQLAAQSNEWASAPVIACLATSALVLPCFILQQVKYDDPDNRLLPRGLFNRDVSFLLAFGFFVMFAMYGVYYYLSTYFQTVKGLSSFDAAVSLLAFFLASGVSSIATGVSMMWIPYANITILVASTLALVGTFLLTTMDEFTTPLHAGLLSIISAIGFGASQTLAIVFSQSWAAKQHQSFIVSVALMVQLFGGTLGLVLGGSVLNTQILYRVEKLDGTLTGDQISAVAMALAMPDRIRDFVPENLIAPLLNVFSSSIQIVFYTCAAAVSIAWILSVCMRWHKMR
ncbi:putative Major facilitator superfamily (MFS) profile domain-containing protein [Seiridium cardinale]|uniref:Major facilitator superfamily (MFS) profile domain-containing protein n=1 Tax=Seiridium cardinale TaxID=138064 RepID=A0ABR2XF85_9PEZI